MFFSDFSACYINPSNPLFHFAFTSHFFYCVIPLHFADPLLGAYPAAYSMRIGGYFLRVKAVRA
jgi:hypothetical protein